MEQKFVKMEDAVEKLGVSADVLNELREGGVLRAYRDGASWKFRADEIEKMVAEGVPEPPPPSDLGLSDDDDLAPLAPEPEESALDLQLDDDAAMGSELDLDNLEDTVTAGASDLAIADTDESSGSSDSILLSEEELGESVSPAGSTIIGKSALEDADLELSLDDDDAAARMSDVRLATPEDGDGILAADDDDDVLELELESDEGAGASAFENLEELEIDLAAESSRILGPDDVSKAQAAAAELSESDLSLDDSSPLAEGDAGSTDVPIQALELADESADSGSGSEIELAVDDDLVLSDTEGSDITLESSDSGINLAPADSGLALDDIPLEMGGSAILSSLDLGSGASDPEISLVGSGVEASDVADLDEEASASEAELQVDDDFQLTPLSEGAPEGEGDSSSQVIALDAGIEGLEDDDLGDDVGVLDDVGMSDDVGDGVMLADDFGEAPDDGLDAGAYAGVGGAAAATELPYSVLQILGLGACVTALTLGSIMMMDMVRHIWSWNEPYTINSTVIDAILGLF